VPTLRPVGVQFGHDGFQAREIQAERLGSGIETQTISNAALICRP
jgi:hypothetical protein